MVWSRISNDELYAELMELQNNDLDLDLDNPDIEVRDYVWQYCPAPNPDIFQMMKDQPIQYILYIAWYMSAVKVNNQEFGSLCFPGHSLTTPEESLLYHAFNRVKVLEIDGESFVSVEDPQPSFVSNFYQAAQAGVTDPLITFLTCKVHEAISKGEAMPDAPVESELEMDKEYKYYRYQPKLVDDGTGSSKSVCIEPDSLIYLPTWLDFEDLIILSTCLEKSTYFRAYVREDISMGSHSKIDEIYLFKKI